ncbi:hypothetical protein ANN_20188 [Periplaneta americana]|uniref:Reverse transcriptase domain-containing protein n=1 Tax=Periplaneta americana TaxID=6978 RepID=A0ABQ8SBY9_PERAM|nr:hypothetical protein ANN_20188 [Periplaneta americana]
MNSGSNTESYPAFAHIRLRENPEKNLNQVTCPDWESNPGHLVLRLDVLAVTPQSYIMLLEDPRSELSPFTTCHWEKRQFRSHYYVYSAEDSSYYLRCKVMEIKPHVSSERASAVPPNYHIFGQCFLSLPLYRIYLEDLVKNCFQNMGGVIVGGRRIKCIRFADDMALLTEEEMILRNMLLELNDGCEQYGMKTNVNKTNTMVKGGKIKKLNFQILNEALEKTDAETDQEEEKELAESLAKKKVLGEGYTGRNGEREKSSGQKKISDDKNHYDIMDHMQRRRGRQKIEKIGESEVETLGHVMGYCPKGELLRNNRHHKVRRSIATTLRKAKWEVYKEVHCLAENGSTRRADIIAIDRRNQRSLILDPTTWWKIESWRRSLQESPDSRIFLLFEHFSPFMARPQVADRGDGLQTWRVAVNILNKQPRTADEAWSSSLGAHNPSP